MTRSVAVAELVKTLLSATNTYAQILLKIVTKLDFCPENLGDVATPYYC